MQTLLFCFFFMTFVQVASAQVDPSSLIIVEDSRSEAVSAPLGSRYSVKPKKKEVPAIEGRPATSIEAPASSKSAPLHQSTTVPQVSPAPVGEGEKSEEDQATVNKLREFVLGGSPEALDEYRAYLPPDDIRRNLMDIHFSTFYMYNESRSPYWYRNYGGYSPGLGFASDIWFTPMFGLNISYRRTVAADVGSSPLLDTRVPANHDWLSFGVRFRRYLGFGEKANSVTFGVDYSEYQMRLPPDDSSHPKLKTASARILVEGKFPKTSKQAMVLGIELRPWQTTTEMDTAISVRSGNLNESYGFGIYYGEEYKLSRTGRIFWKLEYRLDKSLYTGGPNRADPINGTTPYYVPVTNSFTFFDIGYTWGR